MKNLQLFYGACHERASAELVAGSEKVSETQIRFYLRVPQGPPTTRWLGIIDRLIELGDKEVASGRQGWSIDISKHYFRRPELRFAWRLIFQGKDLDKRLPELATAVRSVMVQAQQLDEVRLVGSPTRKVGRYMGEAPTGAPPGLIAR